MWFSSGKFKGKSRGVMNLPAEGEGCVCVCVCARACIHLLTCFSEHFRSSHGSPGNHREELLILPCPTQGLPLSEGMGWPAASSISCHGLFSVCYLSPILYFFFFASFLNCIWPCFDWRMSTSPRRIYKEEEPAGGNESGVRNHQQETSGAPPPSPGS